jgi:hypothetical protein
VKRGLRLALRALAAVLLAAVPLGVLGRSPLAPPRYVLVLDDSPSVRGRFPGFVEKARALWRGFDGGAHPVVAAGSRPRAEGTEDQRPRFTDLPAALGAAASLGTPGVETRILLVTDGLSREERLEETLALLRERRARVWALRPPEPAAQAGAVGIVLPVRVFLQEPFTVRAQVAASRPGPVEVRLLRNGEVAATTTVAVDTSGRAEVDFPQEVDRAGRVRYAVAVAGSPAEPVAGEVTVAQAPRVRWLSGDPGSAAPLIGALRDAGIPVEAGHPAELVSPAQELARDEVVVLDDVPVAALGEDLVEALRQAVAAGRTGLVVVGGRKGLGSGEYAGTALESMLPVTSGYQTPPPPEAVSLVIALDTSLSMFFRGRGDSYFTGNAPNKMDVAIESVKGVVRIVRPEDRLGILGNSDDVFWIKRLAPLGDREALYADLDRVRPRGAGIFFYSVLHEAREALRAAPEGPRHVLVLCDANDIDQYEVEGRGHAFDLIREMAREGITVSILAMGVPVDKDVPFLRTAALLGRGDFYLVPRLVALPRYFTSEYRRLSSSRNFLEEETLPVLGLEAPAGLEGGLPPLAGIALTTAREGSRTLLQTNLGPPLLVAGEYGKGRTVVFAGDNGHRWAGRWVDAAAARRVWLRTLFEAAPPGERERGFDSLLEADPAADRLRFRYAGKEAAFPPWETLRAIPAGGPGDGAPDVLDRVGLRSYRGRAPLGGAGYRRVTVTEDADGAPALLTAGYFVPPAEEDLPLPPRWGAVRRVVKETGGSWVRDPGELRPAPGLKERLPLPLAMALIAAAVALLLTEVAVKTLWEE